LFFGNLDGIKCAGGSALAHWERTRTGAAGADGERFPDDPPFVVFEDGLACALAGAAPGNADQDVCCFGAAAFAPLTDGDSSN
jgi:hypothetical protein